VTNCSARAIFAWSAQAAGGGRACRYASSGAPMPGVMLGSLPAAGARQSPMPGCRSTAERVRQAATSATAAATARQSAGERGRRGGGAAGEVEAPARRGGDVGLDGKGPRTRMCRWWLVGQIVGYDIACGQQVHLMRPEGEAGMRCFIGSVRKGGKQVDPVIPSGPEEVRHAVRLGNGASHFCATRPGKRSSGAGARRAGRSSGQQGVANQRIGRLTRVHFPIPRPVDGGKSNFGFDMAPVIAVAAAALRRSDRSVCRVLQV